MYTIYAYMTVYLVTSMLKWWHDMHTVYIYVYWVGQNLPCAPYMHIWPYIWWRPCLNDDTTCTPHTFTYIYRVGQNHIYIQCVYGIFGRGITIYTVIYGVYIRYWPTLYKYKVLVNPTDVPFLWWHCPSVPENQQRLQCWQTWLTKI